MAASHRISSYSNRSSSPGRPRSQDENKNIWSSMLDGVSSGKRLPEKSLLVLGGTPDTQKEFLESLTMDDNGRRRPPDRGRRPPIANQFALGYTYQDVLDADQDDILARLSLYLLTDPSPSFTPLLKPLLTPRTLPNMLIVILLDWSQPWLWVRQLREWIRVLRSLMVSLDDDCKDVMEENIMSWQERGRKNNLDGTPGTGADGDVSIPIGPGEWDEPLGIPLCVVCQNADKIEALERERGWKEEEFDFVLQYMRTILLKHGASLIYTMPAAPGSLQTLVHSSLGIKSMLQKNQLKHNVIDRDRVLVPPNWDSWGKIRVLRDGFDAEGVSQAWSVDIQTPQPRRPSLNGEANGEEVIQNGAHQEPEEESPAVSIYEETIRDPTRDSLLAQGLPVNTINGNNGIEIDSQDNQAFLGSQLEVLDKLRAEDEKAKAALNKEKKAGAFITHGTGDSSVSGTNNAGSGVVEEHIGPVQFNMGGIQVDADDMLKRLKDREASREENGGDSGVHSPVDDGKTENERLASFFAGLMKKTSSPRS
ncbi:Dynein 1 light intermediate chain [Macrophomina phaseolina MS6]|uniref:Dynein 1 light intermediate chain n=1 Tax=Macrophomina phaseolina (strain MS6) TaxID=1126212 RepID=K2QYU4_MACPH|nr:Dynein 1 light intermediate chain [Macrophomina phaseolina MS6]